MMRNINKVILIGNVTRAPEVRQTSSGQKMATFVLATNRTWFTPNGERQSQAEFHNMLAWGKIAEICERFLQKGTLVYVEGYLKTRSWENENGQRSHRTEIVIQDILVLDRGIKQKAGETASHDNLEGDSDDFFGDDDFSIDGEKSATEIEKTLNQKLAQGSERAAGATKPTTSNDNDVLDLDEPLFAEEK
jgi:single-strand DNA-binding protein